MRHNLHHIMQEGGMFFAFNESFESGPGDDAFREGFGVEKDPDEENIEEDEEEEEDDLAPDTENINEFAEEDPNKNF